MTRRSPILALFVVSGCAGLIYEVVWARQLVLVFGNTTQAVSTILTGFFGGIAVGSVFGGRLGDRVRRPLRTYALLEILLVVVVLATPLTFRLVNQIYGGAYSALQTNAPLLSLVRFGLALLALAPATVLMGATLPILTRYLAALPSQLSTAFSQLYAYNTIGGIFGAIAAGFVLIELIGLRGTLIVGAVCSSLAGLGGLALDRRKLEIQVSPRAPTQSADAAVNSPPQIPLALGFAFASGLTSLGYQVVWTRLLASGTGNSTYVFSMILAVFLTGLAFGALLYADFGARIKDVTGFLALTQLALGAFAVAGMALINWHQAVLPPLPTEYVPLRPGFGVLVVMVVLPATVLMGIAFPAASSLVADARGRIATNSGLLLGANTIGSIAATILIPFAVIPAIGSPATLALLALVNVAVGILIALQKPSEGSGRNVLRARLATAFVGVVVGSLVLVSVGMSELFVDPNVLLVRRLGGKIDASREDEIASVQAGQLNGAKRLWVTGNSMTRLTVDAKLMPILPLMLRPASTTALIVAFGMGSAYRTALIAGLKSTAVEIVPSVPLMFASFYSDAARVLADPRGNLIITDGRNYVELTDRKYDVIVVDPPPPVETAGVSVISSREFYQAARRRLNRGGVMMQWVTYGQTLDEFKAHVRTFRDVFGNVIVARGPAGNGYFMLGSDDPLALENDQVRAVLKRPGVLQDISSAFDSPERTEEGWARLMARLVRLSGAQVSAFAGRGPLITDDRPLPEYFLLRLAFGRASPLLSPESVTPQAPHQLGSAK